MYSLVKTSEVRQLIEICERFARGDFEARSVIASKDKNIANLQDAINNIVDLSDAFIRESSASINKVAHNQYNRHIATQGFGGGFALAAKSINSATKEFISKVARFASVIDIFDLATGRELSSAASATKTLTAVSAALQQNAKDSKARAFEAAATAEQASRNVQAVAGATEELTNAIKEISGRVTNASVLLRSAVEQADATSKGVQGLEAAASQINDVVQLISDIAGQTKLLALNATIEAARAGEAGKGFAVVAQEVKTLAGETDKATAEINARVASIQEFIANAVGSIRDITETINELGEGTTGVVAAIEQQQYATDDIARNAEDVYRGTARLADAIASAASKAEETEALGDRVVEATNGLTKSTETIQFEVNKFLSESRTVL